MKERLETAAVMVAGIFWLYILPTLGLMYLLGYAP